MARFLVVLLIVVAVLALVEAKNRGRYGKYKERRAKKRCTKIIQNFESCLNRGYESAAGCISGTGQLSKKAQKKCGRFEEKSTKCNYECTIPEPQVQPGEYGVQPGKPEVDDYSCKRENVDYWGADTINFFSTGFENCATRCKEDEVCKAIVFRTSDNYCWFKYKRGGNAGPSPLDGHISMNMDCDHGFDPTDRECARDEYDYRGADMKDGYQSQSFEACRTDCHDTEGCVAIAFRKSDHYCWLKSREGGDSGHDMSGIISTNMKCR